MSWTTRRVFLKTTTAAAGISAFRILTKRGDAGVNGKPAVILSRATDETGYSQPTHQQLIAERGPLETGSLFYHMNAVQSWDIAADGSVKNVHPRG